MRHLACAVALALVAGCTYDEGLVINNLRGTVRLPAEAAQGVLLDANGDPQLVEDVGFIGPVYLGLYSAIAPAKSLETYPHPTRGPQFEQGVAADAYPYGGTTVGDFRFSCFTDLVCTVVSGRFESFDDLVDFHAASGNPVVDESGAVVTDGEYMRQVCYDLLDVDSDREVRLTALDEDGDGEVDLDFVPAPDGDGFVADFTLWQQEHFWDQNTEEDCEPGIDCPAFWLWGFMDSGYIPDRSGGPGDIGVYSTCDTTSGAPVGVNQYDANFQGGAPRRNILTNPSAYITSGDWVSSNAFEWQNKFDQPELVLDLEVSQ